MTRQNLRENLGTITKSGTSEFLSAVEAEHKRGKSSEDNLNLIGQFGVGFYSSFLVADRVTVISKHNDDAQHIWTSAAVNDFTVAEGPRRNALGRGTQIILHVKKDSHEFLDDYVLRNLVAKYSEFINFPIYIRSSRVIQIPIVSKDANGDTKKREKEDEDKADVEDVDDEVKESATATETVYAWDLMNTQRSLWIREPKDVTNTEYIEFFRAFTKQPAQPLAWTHFKGEGEVNFRALIYIPMKESEAFFRGSSEAKRNVKLFVKHVFITDDLGLSYIPKWLARTTSPSTSLATPFKEANFCASFSDASSRRSSTGSPHFQEYGREGCRKSLRRLRRTTARCSSSVPSRTRKSQAPLHAAPLSVITLP